MQMSRRAPTPSARGHCSGQSPLHPLSIGNWTTGEIYLYLHIYAVLLTIIGTCSFLFFCMISTICSEMKTVFIVLKC